MTPRRYGRAAQLTVALLVVFICATVGAGIGVANWLRRDLPSTSSLQTIAPPVKTLVYDRNGKLVHEFYKENRTLVPLRQIPQPMIDAILAIEDRRFYTHWGIDPIRTVRALLANIIARRPEQGGSTITQQLARNLFLTHEKTFSRKLKEAILAVRIERAYTKDEILEMYFNQIYFGEGAYGIDAAAKAYFGKQVQDLTLPECALLAGMPRNPRDYSPRRDPDRALRRRNLVLAAMLQSRKITDYETKIQALKEESARLAPQLAKIRKLTAEREEVNKRLGIIASLDKDRYLHVRMMNDLAVQVPDNCWIEEVDETGGSSVDIKGVTFSNFIIADFMTSLERSGRFSDVALVKAEEGDIDDVRVVKFEVSAKLVN